VANLRLVIALAVVIGLGVDVTGMIEQAQAPSATPAEPQSSQLEARAAAFPVLAAIMVCTRPARPSDVLKRLRGRSSRTDLVAQGGQAA
jgi:hypothetical protein